MKTNHDGTVTLNAYDTWTSCVACGQRVTGDSIHTCSPQLKKQDTDCQYCKQGCIRCDARKQLTDEDIAKVVHELNQKANTPERWVTAMQIGAETIIQLRDELAILRKAQE